jgi:hypothetical protein
MSPAGYSQDRSMSPAGGRPIGPNGRPMTPNGGPMNGISRPASPSQMQSQGRRITPPGQSAMGIGMSNMAPSQYRRVSPPLGRKQVPGEAM